MKILHIIRTLNPAVGGPVQGVRNLTKATAARGHSPEVLSLDNPEDAWISRWEGTVHAVGSCRSTYSYSKPLDHWLSANLASYDAAVVSGVWTYPSYAVRREALRTGTPYFILPHGALDPWFRRYPLKHIKKCLYWAAFEHKVLRDADAVFFTTEEEKQLAEGAFFPYSCRAEVTGYGIFPPPRPSEDPATGQCGPTHWRTQLSGRRYFLFLARIHQKKGIDLALEAFAATKSRFPGMALVIAGPGNENLIGSLRRLAQRLGVDDAVIWAGPLYDSAKWNALRGAEAYILPSHQENFGISVVESLGCGVPVIISNKVNIWREVVSDEAGIVNADTVAGTVESLRRWAELSPQEKSEMSLNGNRCFTKNFDIRATSERFLSLLQGGVTRRAQIEQTELHQRAPASIVNPKTSNPPAIL